MQAWHGRLSKRVHAARTRAQNIKDTPFKYIDRYIDIQQMKLDALAQQPAPEYARYGAGCGKTYLDALDCVQSCEDIVEYRSGVQRLQVFWF